MLKLEIDKLRGYSFVGEQRDHDQKQHIYGPADKKLLSRDERDHVLLQGDQVVYEENRRRKQHAEHGGIGHVQTDDGGFQVVQGPADVPKQPRQNPQSVLHVVCPEKDPGEAKQRESEGKLPPAFFIAGSLPAFRVQENLGDLQKAVESTPQKIGQAATVPETADQKGEKEIQAVPPFGHPVAAKRNIDIIPKPGGQGNMPAAPEFPDGESQVGAFKICHQFDAKKPCAADGDVRVAGKVTVNFDGEHDRHDDKDKTDIAVRVVVDLVDHYSENVRDHQLFKITPGHQLEPVGRVFIVEASLRFELRQKGSCAADGACQKLREEGDKEGVVAEVPLRPDFSLIDVDQIAHGLEKVKGNTRGQQDFHGQGVQCKTPGVDQGVDF